MVRRRMVFTGWVQGVGFRYRAKYAAERYGCTGWVRNEWDGSVTMELQGGEREIESVLKELRGSRFLWTENTQASAVPQIPDERDFKVM